MSGAFDNEYDDEECWNCGGIGRVNDCIDGCCADQDDPWCEYCSKRSNICKPKGEASEELREVLAEALEKAHR